MRYGCYMEDTPVGRLRIAEKDGRLTHILFCPAAPPEPSSGEGIPIIAKVGGRRECFSEKETPLLRDVKSQLAEYFTGKRKEFDIPLAPEGTDFQLRVWEALLSIPYGETRSYKEIAETVGNPKAYRAVGLVNNRNPINIVVPCHRVIGADGKLAGFGGGLEIKAALLKSEAENR